MEKYIEKFLKITGLNTFNLNEFFIFLSIPVVCFIIELCILGWSKSSLRNLIFKFYTSRNDIFCTILSYVKLFRLFTIIFTFGIFYILAALLYKKVNFNAIEAIKNPYLNTLILLLASDLKSYIRHRYYHHANWIWEIHKYHHSAEKFTMLTSGRVHFVESAVNSFFDVLPFIVFGAPIQTWFYISILKVAHEAFAHSEIRSNWGLIGSFILVSPSAHRLHHSIEERHHNKNFGVIFIFWDRLLGTYHPPENVEILGIRDNPFNNMGFFRGMLLGNKNSLEALKISALKLFKK